MKRNGLILDKHSSLFVAIASDGEGKAFVTLDRRRFERTHHSQVRQQPQQQLQGHAAPGCLPGTSGSAAGVRGGRPPSRQ